MKVKTKIMILWTIQPENIYYNILDTGFFHCDFNRIQFPEFKLYYDWLAEEMVKRIGQPPVGVSYPVWAWYTQNGIQKKPDLRRERWQNGWKGDRFVCIVIDIPEDKVLLSDFDAWSIILNNGLLSESEQEDMLLEERYNTLSPDLREEFKRRNWERVFDIELMNNNWMSRGLWIQATFWELRKEDIRNVLFFTAAKPKRMLYKTVYNITNPLIIEKGFT